MTTKVHWSQTPEGKAKLARNMRRVWRNKRKAALGLGVARTLRAQRIVTKAVRHERNGQRPAVYDLIKRLIQQRDALSTTITVLKQELHRG